MDLTYLCISCQFVLDQPILVVPEMLQIHEQYAIMLTASEVSIEIHYEVQQQTPGC
jgi:hypothetical protein